MRTLLRNAEDDVKAAIRGMSSYDRMITNINREASISKTFHTLPLSTLVVLIEDWEVENTAALTDGLNRLVQ